MFVTFSVKFLFGKIITSVVTLSKIKHTNDPSNKYNQKQRMSKIMNYEKFVEFMSSWKSMRGYYAIRIPLYGIFAFLFGSMSYSIIVDSWGDGEKILNLIVGFGMFIFCVFIVTVAVLGTLDAEDREWKAFGYKQSEEDIVRKEIEKILKDAGLKYHKTGPKWNLLRFQKYFEVYCLDGWTIRCFFYKARKGPYYEALILEIGPISENLSVVEHIKHQMDERLRPFHLG